MAWTSQHHRPPRTADRISVAPTRNDTRITEIGFVDGYQRPGYGLGQALDQLRELAQRPSENTGPPSTGASCGRATQPSTGAYTEG